MSIVLYSSFGVLGNMAAGNSSLVHCAAVRQSGRVSIGSPVAIDDWWMCGYVNILWASPYACKMGGCCMMC